MTEKNMSKLEKLIQQYCPDGVEYVRLGDILSVNRGKRLTKTQLSDDGKYYVYHGSKDTPLGKYSQFNVKGNTTIVVNTGGIGGVKYCDEDFWCSDGSFWIGHSALLNDKYVYYYLSPKESYFASQKRVGGVPTIDKSTIENIEIPVPPLPVQEEIVRVLDAFTELQAELQAELQKRKQQYDFYRDNLLNFKDINRGGYQAEVRWMKLKDLARVCRGTRVVKSQLSNEGYPVYQNCLTPMGYYDKTNCKGGTPFVICGGAAGSVGYSIIDCWAADDCEYVVSGPDVCNKYLYYCLMAKKDYLSSQVRKASIPRLSPNVIKELVVPVPSLAGQQRIVAILDRFDALTNDLTSGLPAEMEKRRQQYEFYRDKLLTFKRKEA